jgi:multiple sugar transport system substrate-binding protein
MYRKAFALMALVVVAGLVLTACAPQTVTVTVPVKETVQVPVEKTVVVPAERVTVRLSGWAANPQETALLESLLYRFSVENPDIVVKYEPITGDYWQAIKTLVGAGEEPDIYYMDIFQFPFFAKEGVLLPLDDLMASTGTSRDVFIPDLINAFTYEGKTYGIPRTSTPWPFSTTRTCLIRPGWRTRRTIGPGTT